MNNNNLRLIRLEIGMSISELARRSNLSRMTIWKVESSKSNPTVKTIKVICSALNKKPEEIFFDQNVNHDLQRFMKK